MTDAQPIPRVGPDAALSRAVGAAIKRALVAANLNQSDLAATLGKGNATVSEWVRGRTLPSLAQLLEIEDVVGLPHGTVLRDAHVFGVPNVEAAIRSDPELDEPAQDLLIREYHRQVRDSLQRQEGHDAAESTEQRIVTSALDAAMLIQGTDDDPAVRTAFIDGLDRAARSLARSVQTMKDWHTEITPGDGDYVEQKVTEIRQHEGMISTLVDRSRPDGRRALMDLGVEREDWPVVRLLVRTAEDWAPNGFSDMTPTEWAAGFAKGERAAGHPLTVDLVQPLHIESWSELESESDPRRRRAIVERRLRDELQLLEAPQVDADRWGGMGIGPAPQQIAG